MWEKGTPLVIKECVRKRIVDYFIPSILIGLFPIMIFSSKRICYGCENVHFDYLVYFFLGVSCIGLLLSIWTNKENVVIVDEKGVYLKGEKKRFSWDKIACVYTDEEVERRSGHNPYFDIVLTDGTRYSYLIEHHAVNDFDLMEAVYYWSGRNIGHWAFLRRDKMLREGKYANQTFERIADFLTRTDKYLPMFIVQFKKEKLIHLRFEQLLAPYVFAVFFALLLAVSFENQSHFGYIATVVVLGAVFYAIQCVLLWISQSIFLHQKEVKQIPTEEIEEYYEIIGGKNNWKLKLLYSLIVILLAIWQMWQCGISFGLVVNG